MFKMKNILCYGDSNTWGFIPEKGNRYPADVRWTGRLASALGSDYHVKEEGLCGRTTSYELPLEHDRNGFKTFPIILESASPLDLVILMLGTNDRRMQICASPQESALAMERYIQHIRMEALRTGDHSPEILIISPPLIEKRALETEVGFYYGEKSIRDCQNLAKEYRRLSQQHHCAFLDASRVCSASREDGVHLDDLGHRELAWAVLEKVQGIFHKNSLEEIE